MAGSARLIELEQKKKALAKRFARALVVSAGYLEDTIRIIVPSFSAT